MVDYFLPFCGLFIGPAWSCEREVSRMGKTHISYRQMWENVCFFSFSLSKCGQSNLNTWKTILCVGRSIFGSAESSRCFLWCVITMFKISHAKEDFFT